MKRQLKFRAWDPNEDMMRYEISISYDGVVESSWGKDKYDWIPLQFTGLYDVDGKEIYEGDVVDIVYPDYDDRNEEVGHYIVIYSDRWAEFKLQAANSMSFYLERYRNFKVIGNMYENPELL